MMIKRWVVMLAVLVGMLGGVMAQPDGTLVYGATVSAEVEGGESRVYTFEGAAGELVAVHALKFNRNINLTLQLFDPDGVGLTTSAANPLDSRSNYLVLRYLLPDDGLYRLDVGNTNSVSVEFVLTIQAQQVAMIATLGDGEARVIEIGAEPQIIGFALNSAVATEVRLSAGRNTLFSAEILDDRGLIVAHVDRFVTDAQLTLPPGPGTRYQLLIAAASNLGGEVTVSVVQQGSAEQQGSDVVTDCVNESEFIADMTVPDGAPVAPGEAFTKVWRFRNVGTCAWDNYTLTAVQMDALVVDGPRPQITIPLTLPGEEVDITVDMILTAQTALGETVRTTFEIRDRSGVTFGGRPYVEVTASANEEG